MQSLKRQHSFAIQWFHWINFPLLFLMIWSGLMIYWANSVYRAGWGDTTLIHFFPDSFFQALALPRQLAFGMALHFFFMWFFVVNGAIYVFYLLLSGNWRELIPNRSSFRDAVLVALHDLHLRKTCPPQTKYNGAQRIAYTGVTLMGAASLITGAAIYKPSQLAWLTNLLGGYDNARLEHFWLMIGFVFFFAVHVIQVINAGWNNFRSMVTGYVLTPAPEEDHEP